VTVSKNMFRLLRNAMLLCGLFGFASSLVAVTAVSQAQNESKNRYAIIDMQAVILNVEEGKQARSALEAEIRKKEADLMKQKEELDKMHQEWQGNAALLSESARMTKQQEFQEKFLGLRQAEMQFQQEIQRKEQEATQKIAISVSRVVEQLADERGFAAVFEVNSSGLVYLRDPVDLTREVIEVYGKDSKTAKKD